VKLKGEERGKEVDPISFNNPLFLALLACFGLIDE